MPRHLMLGESLFILFDEDGESVFDSQNRPRMYKSIESFKKAFPKGIGGTKLVEYETATKGEWLYAKPNGFEGQKPFVCSECGLRHPRFGNTDQVYFRFCPWCGSEMSKEPEPPKEDEKDA